VRPTKSLFYLDTNIRINTLSEHQDHFLSFIFEGLETFLKVYSQNSFRTSSRNSAVLLFFSSALTYFTQLKPHDDSNHLLCRICLNKKFTLDKRRLFTVE